MDGNTRITAHGGQPAASCRGRHQASGRHSGHLSIDTTAIYTKIDLDRLAKVALPWPAAQTTKEVQL